jgi:hypothetical protein
VLFALLVIVVDVGHGDAEVDEFDEALLCDAEVVEFDVLVDVLPRVDILNCLKHLK